MTSPWEKALDVAMTQSEALTVVGAGVLAVCVGLLRFLPQVTVLVIALLAVAAGFSLISSLLGVAFQSLIVNHLLAAKTGWGYVYRDALRDRRVRNTMWSQILALMAAMLGLLAAGATVVIHA
jgi:hypothetical protein